MGTDFSNLTSVSPWLGASATSDSAGMLLRAMYPSGRTRVVVKVDLNEGSSKQGKAFRASV